MANSVKGEIGFNALDRNFILVYDFNSLVELEDAFDAPVADLEAVMAGRMKNVRTVFRLGLARHHPDVDDVTAGQIIGDIGIARTSDLIGEAFVAAFPDAAKTGEAGKTAARPPKG